MRRQKSTQLIVAGGVAPAPMPVSGFRGLFPPSPQPVAAVTATHESAPRKIRPIVLIRSNSFFRRWRESVEHILPQGGSPRLSQLARSIVALLDPRIAMRPAVAREMRVPHSGPSSMTTER
jgi:hypothetical protein